MLIEAVGSQSVVKEKSPLNFKILSFFFFIFLFFIFIFYFVHFDEQDYLQFILGSENIQRLTKIYS
jgi:hypothetical protein